MIVAKKVRLFPTEEQEPQLWKSVGTARFVYNWALSRQIEHFKATEKLSKISDGNLRKDLTQLKKTEEFAWLSEVSNNVAKQSVKDLCKAIDRFHKESKKNGYRYRKSAIKNGKQLTFKDFEGFPRFKKRGKAKASFYNDNVKLKVRENLVLLEKVGWVKTKEQLPLECKHTNPRISNDGKYWYISVGIDVPEKIASDLTDVSLGIDVGIKDLAICSDGQVFKNINKTQAVKKLEKRLRRLKRQVSRKYEMNKEGRRFVKTQNIIKLEKKIQLVQRRLSGIRNNHTHQATNAIVKTKPSRVVVETLNIKGMMKNRHLAKAVQQQKLYAFKQKLKYKCERQGIEFVEADTWFPSSKTCSCCGTIKKDLKLSDRVYKCECGLKIDRDMNAAINLSRYEITKESVV